MNNTDTNIQKQEINKQYWELLQAKDYSTVDTLIEWINLAHDSIIKNQNFFQYLEEQKNSLKETNDKHHEKIGELETKLIEENEKTDQNEQTITELQKNIATLQKEVEKNLYHITHYETHI
jgi:septal ring factor EnvC (AmiA/AmiB activator)